MTYLRKPSDGEMVTLIIQVSFISIKREFMRLEVDRKVLFNNTRVFGNLFESLKCFVFFFSSLWTRVMSNLVFSCARSCLIVPCWALKCSYWLIDKFLSILFSSVGQFQSHI